MVFLARHALASWREALTPLKTFFYCAIAALILDGVLIAPNHPGAMNVAALTMVPLELPFILLGLWLLPAHHRGNAIIRNVLVGLLLLILIGRVADYATFIAFDRSFNSLVDWNLIGAGWLTLAGSIGWALTAAASAALLAIVVLVALVLRWAVRVWALLPMPKAARPWALVGLVLSLTLTVIDVGHHRHYWTYAPPGDAFTARTATSNAIEWSSTVAGLRAFSRSVKYDPFAGQTALLSRLNQHDVLIIFVESYGRSSFDNPLYAQTHVPTLQRAERRLADQGLEMRSGWLEAAMIGGQSWLSHSTVASGLWIDNQGRYRMLLKSQRPTLYHYAQQAGFQTMAVMPGIRMDWPEADYFGFDKIWDANNLGYQGEPFNWVTMPDQFTLSAFDQLARQAEPRKPIFAQIALISSHAPWVPVAPMIDWTQVGDGTVFNQWANTGDSPEVVWRDPDRVRDQFRQSLDYSLQVVLSYAERQAHNMPLIIILGDHEPARFVSQRPGREVAIHMIGTPSQIAAIQDWQWTPGLIPAGDLPVWRMDQFRDQFITAYSEIAP
jgi:hypothetical protein